MLDTLAYTTHDIVRPWLPNPAQCHCFYARRQPVSLRSDFFAPKYPVLNSGTIIEFLSKNETIVIIYYYAIYFP